SARAASLLASWVWRTDTWISVAVTPRQVAPPLSPSNTRHGGEYGSPGTWSSRSAQRATPPASGTPASPPPEPDAASGWPVTGSVAVPPGPTPAAAGPPAVRPAAGPAGPP